jgi:hypothetical protein
LENLLEGAGHLPCGVRGHFHILFNAFRNDHLFVFFGAIEPGVFDELLEEWQAVLEADLDFLSVSEGNVISG